MWKQGQDLRNYENANTLTIRHYVLVFIALATMWVSFSSGPVLAQAPAQQKDSITIEGTVRDSAGDPIAEVAVVLEDKGYAALAEMSTKTDGTFVFSPDRAGTYRLRAEKAGLGSAAAQLVMLSGEKKKHLDLVIESSRGAKTAPPDKTPATHSSPGAIEFQDKPSFTVAGITDWSNVGLHGSDSSSQTSETLATETLALKSSGSGENSPGASAGATTGSDKPGSESNLRAALARAPNSFAANHRLGEYYLAAKTFPVAIPLLEAAYRINPGDRANAYDLAAAYKANGDFAAARAQVRKLLASGANGADEHHMLGELDERSGDPLEAVREFERAVRLEPSEQNYFDWGAELLLHKAAVPATEVFSKGSGAHPQSARMLAGLGAALYASGSYDEAARRLCEASDLNPSESAPYIFLGQMEKAAPESWPCSEQKLGRFAHDQPGNALGNYYYALVLWKRARTSENLADAKQAQGLLENAVKINPRLGEAHLQLGILYSERRDSGRAIRAYKQAIEVDPSLGEAHYRLSLSYKQIGEHAKARQELQAYKEAQKTEAAALEQKRKELQQFLVILGDQQAAARPH
jgi:tetratricopeptide (TPR) repeat protein